MKNTNFVYLNSKFEIDTLESHYIAKASYRQCLHENGWNFLHISTNSDADLLDQHRGAGYIEGYLTYQEIYCAYKNLEGAIIKKKELSENTQKFVDDQFRYIEFMIKENKDSLFWRYAEAYLEQLRFIYKGF